MNLRHLRCFVAVGEELHFGRAARRLHVEQSPLSRTIRQLEADLGVTLLERMPRSVCLTPAGQVFLEEARRVLLTLEQARTKARAVAAGLQGTLRIALTGCAGQVRLPALLALCREEACHRPAHWSQLMIGTMEPPRDRHIEASRGSAHRGQRRIGVMEPLPL